MGSNFAGAGVSIGEPSNLPSFKGLAAQIAGSHPLAADIAERAKDIVCDPENLAPKKSQSSLLRRCLERKDSCHFFTREAKGWHWVKWLHEQGLLPDLFDRSRRELIKPQADLARWLARELLAEESDEGLLLVEKPHGCIGRRLWSALWRGLWLNGNVNWSSPLIHKWGLVLAETCPPDSMGKRSHLPRIVAKAAPHTLGMALLRRLTDLRIVVSKGFDFASHLKGGDTVESKDKAELQIAVAREVYELDRVWEECFKPRLSELRESLLLLLENRLREGHELCRVVHPAKKRVAKFDVVGRFGHYRPRMPTVKPLSCVWSPFPASERSTTLSRRHPRSVSIPRGCLGLLLGLLMTACASQAQVPNTLPLRIGADQEGKNLFRGELAAVRLYDRALSRLEITNLARAHPNTQADLPGLTAQWLFGGNTDGLLADDPALPARREGEVAPRESAGVACAALAGGYFTVAHQARLAFAGGTVEAWIRPEAGTVGRIVDKITPGGSNGWLLDTYPGDSLRLVVGHDTFTHPWPHTARWTHVAATVDTNGAVSLFVNGARVVSTDVVEEDVVLAGAAAPPGTPLTLWYRRPARRWSEASVIGNGRLGGMVWGGIRQERIDLNEDTLWSGEPYDNLNTNGLKSLPVIRALLLEGKNAEAQALVERHMNGKYNQCYLPLGELKIDFPTRGEVRDYRRQLDLEEGIARVTFAHEGTRYLREVFASHPDQALVVRLTADRPGQISFQATLGSQLRHAVTAARYQPNEPIAPATAAAAANVLRLTGRAPVHADPHYLGKRIEYDDAPDGKGMRFETRLAAAHTGGALRFTEAGLVAERCDSVTLLLVAATSYHGPHLSPSSDGRDPSRLCDAALAPLPGRAYDLLRADHLADHQRLFQRVRLDLGRTDAEDLPTDARLQRYQPGSDPSLAALYFQFGRYLLIAGSRPGTQPLNLQGIWNKDLNPAWSANWTLNCNAQINYWPVEVANLAECHEPLLDLTAELSIDGKHIAQNLYGAGGWIAHHNTDIWRQAGPVSGSACWSVFQGGSAWLCQHLWEHYAFSGDPQVLRRIWPVLSGAARFYLDSLIAEPSHGWLVTAPDVNFENAFKKPDGSGACSCYGPTATMQMVRELFANCLKAETILQANASLRAEIEAALPRLAPMRISPTTGELQEWVDDWQRTAECQVLSSWGAICSAQITPRQTPALAAGLRLIFDRGNWWKNGAVGSWQGAFQANAYARLHEGDLSLQVLDTHLRQAVNPNFSARFGGVDWEIDGNLGLTAVVAEMLLQSQTDAIELLPALPKAWAKGSVKGLRARGAFEVDLAWENGRLTRTSVRALRGGSFQLRYGERVENVTLPRGGTLHWQPN